MLFCTLLNHLFYKKISFLSQGDDWRDLNQAILQKDSSFILGNKTSMRMYIKCYNLLSLVTV